MDGHYTTLCRICLGDGANIPIFEGGETISSRISTCMSEKIEDIAGFPRNICDKCNNTLEAVCNFINKFKESCKILQNSLIIVKKEKDLNYFSDNTFSEPEIEIKAIKRELDDSDYNALPEDLVKLVKPLKLKITKIKNEATVKKERSKKKKHSISNTNKIASSILEGDFAWNGEKWCFKSNQTVQVKQKRPIKREKEREEKIKIPKLKEVNPSKLCELCGQVFKTADKLSIHRKTVHFKASVTCPKCSRVCASEYYLNRHIKRKHEKIRNFICSTCGKGFVFKGELSSHFRTVHEKELKPKKIFACKFCDKTYKCAKSVTVHERSVHTGQRPAVCSVCGSSFYHDDYLKEHMRLHTGETPFKCPVCGRGYAQRCNMKSHLRIHRISELDPLTLSKMKPNYLKLLKV